MYCTNMVNYVKFMMKSAGFSLLELLIVIMIIGILSLMGVNSWRELKLRSELSVVTLNVVQFLNDVKTNANFYNYTQYLFIVKLNKDQWCLVASLNEQIPNQCDYQFNFKPEYSTVEIIGSYNRVLGSFYGRRSTAKAVTIKLKNPIGESRIIISVPGRIRYCSYHTYLAGLPKC